MPSRRVHTCIAMVAGLAVLSLATAQERFQRPPPSGAVKMLASQPPANLRAEPQDPLLHKITWSDPGAGRFRIFRRSASAPNWTPVADEVTGTEYLDRAVVSPGTVYRVEALYPTGRTAAAEVVYPNPLQPPVPQEFHGWQDPSELVTLRWTHVANVTAYRVFGPTLPPDGALVDTTRWNYRNGGWPFSYTIPNVPAGTQTFSVAGVYGDAGYSVEGMPTTTVATKWRKNRYRISVTGLRTLQATNDDPILHRDGKGDEIFVAAFVGSDIAQYNRLDRNIVRSRVYGDVNRFPDRIQAGTSSPSGGIGPGNTVPVTLVVWEGELWDGDRGLAVVPTVWEWDGDEKNYRAWSGWLMGTRYDWHETLVREMKPGPIERYGIGPKLGPDMFGVSIDDSFGKDLPLGYFNMGMGTRSSYGSMAFLISRGRIERTLGSNASTVIPTAFRTSGGVGGEYELLFQIERLPRT